MQHGSEIRDYIRSKGFQSRALSQCFSTTSVYALLVSRRAEPICIRERLARVQAEHKVTQSQKDPGHEVYPHTDAQIKLCIVFSVLQGSS